MSKLTRSLAAKLDEHIIENFADIYTLEEELAKIAMKHDLDDPAVIAAIATCADVASAQARLVTRAPAALVEGIPRALAGELRTTARLLAEAILDGARHEVASPPAPAKPAKNALPAYARISRLPPVTLKGEPVELEPIVRALAAAQPGKPPELVGDDASLARLGRALALGWLSHGAEPKHAWGAWAAAYFPDDATARDLAMMAKELGPRVGQFSKAQILVDVLAEMNTRVALEQLHMLATKVNTRSVKDRAKAAFDAAAKRTGITEHDLADKLVDERTVGKDFIRRLEQRMVTRAKLSTVELFENILQKPAVRNLARGVVFGVLARSLVPFVIDDERLVDCEGDEVTLETDARIIVVHPLDLTRPVMGRWRAIVGKQPFPQLDRPVHRFVSTHALKKHLKATVQRAAQRRIYGLEARGWARTNVAGGTFAGIERELDGVVVSVDIEPGIELGGGPARAQTITGITVKGKASVRAMAELAYDLASLGAP
jgi:Domain of unknown function (DUF4132)